MKNKIDPKLLKLSLLISFFTIGLVFIIATNLSLIKRNLLSGHRINILLLGISETDYARFAEVINLISYEPVTGFIDIVSIPRDSMVSVPYKVSWKRIQKLDEVYSRYFRKSKDLLEIFYKFKAKTEKVLENYFVIDYYVQVDYKAFEDFIDALGGVELEVMKKMEYDDDAQDLHIHISTGINKFYGSTALKYVRYRDKIMGDIGRQDRQHKFLKAVIEKMKKPESVFRIFLIIKSVIKNVDTNLTFFDFITIIDELRNFNSKNFRIQKIPGKPVNKWGKSYWKINKIGMREVLDVVKNSALINLPSVEVDLDLKIETRITAEVWNATNEFQLARNLTKYLRERNVDVVRYGNYGVHKKYTQIISRTGDLNPAREVSKLLGCSNIITELDSSRMVDINIVIGSDYKKVWKE